LLIDIDHFKNINDTWGHDVGDEAIIAITRQLQMTLRSGDYIGRFGGDEFAVIMSGGAPCPGCMSGWKTVVTVRAKRGAAHQRGRCPLGPQFGHYREWLKAADVALYKAKNAGRGRTEVAA
jgi:diguanylate cyclase